MLLRIGKPRTLRSTAPVQVGTSGTSGEVSLRSLRSCPMADLLSRDLPLRVYPFAGESRFPAGDAEPIARRGNTESLPVVSRRRSAAIARKENPWT